MRVQSVAFHLMLERSLRAATGLYRLDVGNCCRRHSGARWTQSADVFTGFLHLFALYTQQVNSKQRFWKINLRGQIGISATSLENAAVKTPFGSREAASLGQNSLKPV